jgi:hypothetical protein
MPSRKTTTKDRSESLSAERRSVQLREQIEAIGAEFDESSVHVAGRDAFREFALGPVRDLPADGAAAGSIGWSREIHPKDGAAPHDGEELDRVASLYLVITPIAPGRRPSESDVPGAGAGSVEFLEVLGIKPRAILAARCGSKRAVTTVRAFARALQAELEDEIRDG